ncbi:tyrosine--tRNA ligase [Candidatus Parcubacteria bacterium]|nr:tyrosine--tRNA ligase [Candidatus Parcubacteria bacterium]
MGDAIQQLLTHSVETVIEREHLEKRLRAGTPLRVKHGIDPTGPKIHLGRAVVLWKLREFQDLGHHVVLIVGDYTAQIGDASDKTQRRAPLTTKQVQENLKGYLDQIAKIIDVAKAEVRYNSEWLAKLDGQDLVALAREFTVYQMLARRNFKDRFDGGREIGLDEFLYPLFQGYDSVAVKADVEIGGSDQLFNLTAGRKIQEHFGQPPQDILTTKMLIGLDGRKMSTSWGNVVNITDSPTDQFGKLMSLRDDLTPEYLELASGLPASKVAELTAALKAGTSPRDIKAQMAEAVVARYHGESAARRAAAEFSAVFGAGGFPEDAPPVAVSAREQTALELVMASGLAPSKSEARRLIAQGAVELDKSILRDANERVIVRSGSQLRVGKHRFAKIVLADND